MTKLIFRLLLILGGLFCLYITGKPLVETFSYNLSGEKVSGRIIGFRGKGASKSILTENSGTRNGKRTARRPVFRYPIVEGSIDSLDAYSSSGMLFSFANFELNDAVTVVLKKEDPTKAYIFSKGIIFTDLMLVFLSIFMVGLGMSIKSG